MSVTVFILHTHINTHMHTHLHRHICTHIHTLTHNALYVPEFVSTISLSAIMRSLP